MDLVDIPENPIPPGAVCGEISTPDGRRLRYARFPANATPLRGTVTILQGRAEFIEKYFETVNDLRQRGFAVVAFDWRGQGGSERLLRRHDRGYVDSFYEYVRDLLAIMEQVSLPDSPGPHYGLAHSTGGAVALLGHARLRTVFERMVLSSPLVGFGGLGRWQRCVSPAAALLTAFGLAEIAVGATDVLPPEESFQRNPLTSDRQRFDRMAAILAAAPGLDTGRATIGWINAASHAMRTICDYDFAPKVSLPMLIVAAGADQVVSASASEELASRMRAVGYVAIPGARHELLMEADRFREQFWAAFDAFIPGSE